MKNAIEKTREIYNEKKKRFSIVNIFRDKLCMPRWVKDSNDELKVIYEDASLLYKEGDIVYAYLIQANSLLFKEGVNNHPACVLFSTDKYFDDNLDKLEVLARHLYDYKGAEDVPENIRKFIDVITDEYIRLFNVKLPYEITKGRDVYYTTIMVHRNHIPGRYIKESYFPLLIAQNKTKASIILPKHYWSEDMLRRWEY